MVFLEELRGYDLQKVKYQEYFLQLCFRHSEYRIGVVKLF